MRLTEQAYAKVNLWLSVGDKRPDGYHDVETVMHTVSLCDTVALEISEGDGISLAVTGDGSVPCDARNLAWRACETFLRHSGRTARVRIEIDKRIPAGGGLAGGSSDAAAVLRALNRAFDSPYTPQQLMELAAELGSDVSFCVLGGTALCRGRGEVVTALEDPKPLHLLLAFSGEHVSTPDAYRLLDADGGEERGGATLMGCLGALQEGSMAGLEGHMYNRFEKSILPTCPVANAYRNALARAGGVSRMSGSGSTVFAVFESEERALEAQKLLDFEVTYATSVKSYFKN